MAVLRRLGPQCLLPWVPGAGATTISLASEQGLVGRELAGPATICVGKNSMQAPVGAPEKALTVLSTERSWSPGQCPGMENSAGVESTFPPLSALL